MVRQEVDRESYGVCSPRVDFQTTSRHGRQVTQLCSESLVIGTSRRCGTLDQYRHMMMDAISLVRWPEEIRQGEE